MMKSVVNKVMDKVDKVIVGIIVSTIVGIYVNYAFPKISNPLKENIIVGITAGIILILAVLVIVYLFKIIFRKNLQFQEPDVVLKWVEENIQNKDVKDAINKFSRKMDQFFETFAGDTVFDIKSKWLVYKEDRGKLNEFVNNLHSYLLKKNLNDDESVILKKRLSKIYNEFFENIRRIKILKMDSENMYVDLNDKKLNRDIQEYEPYLGYWEKSDEWVNNKMLKYVNKIRKNNSSIYFLDIGTGTGRIVKFLCKENDIVYLVDYDEKRLSEAKGKVKEIIKNEEHIKCIKSHFEKLENQDERNKVGLINYYDIIICSHVIQHNSTEEVLNFYKIIYNLLTSDGILFLLFPISKSNRDEFVVHGLEFDIVKINKRDFLRSQRDKVVENLDIYLRTAAGFDTLDTHFSNNKDNSGYWKVTKEPSKKLLYEIAERKDAALAYKRVFDKGLICSIDTKYAQDFSNQDNFSHVIQVINECLKKYTAYSEQIPENSSILSNILSEYWLISDIKNNNNVMLFDKCGHYISKRVERVITKHRVHNDLLNSGQIPLEFLDFIPGGNGISDLKKNENNSVWEIKNNLGENIASIYKTETYYSLILDNEEEHEVNIDTEELLIKQVPSMLKEKFFKRVEHLSDFIVDSEVLDGWFIKHDGKVCYFARYDNDWIRIFRTEPVFTELVEGKLSIEDHNKFPFKLWNEENIIIKPLVKDKMWKLEMESGKKEKFTVLPSYTIIRIIKDSDKKYCAYRDKKYYRLSSLTFNNLCRQQMEGLRILPTHRFIISNLKKDLKKDGLIVKAHTLYHSFAPKQSFIDKLGLRDKYFNLCILKWFKRIHKKFDIQDCMFVIKKKWIKKEK